MTTPAVTAVVAAYKAGDYLREAVGSALAQTFPDLEVLVSDDAADPAVERLTRSFGDERVRYRSNPTRLGPAGNHAAAFADARGPLVGILNHDDWWAPDFLSRLVPAFADPAVVLAFCDHEVIDTAGRVLAVETDRVTRFWGRHALASGVQPDFPGLVVGQAIPMAMGAVFRRAALAGDTLPASSGPAYDLWLTYRLAASGGTAHYTPERLTGWRTHPANLTTAGTADWTLGALGCWQAMAADPAYRPHLRTVNRKLTAGYRTLVRGCLARGDRPAARRWAALAVRTVWTDWRNSAMLTLAVAPLAVGRWLVRNR